MVAGSTTTARRSGRLDSAVRRSNASCDTTYRATRWDLGSRRKGDEHVNDYFGGQSPQQLEDLLRKLITQGAEGPKVDFKKSLTLGDKAAQAELAKDISSIANTDDEAHLDDFGYIILGAERGKLVGGVSELTGDIDKLQSQITDVIKGFVGPVPQFSLSAFDDNPLGRWGVIVIPPSARQPHLLVRDGAGDVVKHEWWIRVNDTKERAGPHDYARILAKATRREVRPLELEVQRLALKVDQLGVPNLSVLADLLRGSRPSAEPRQEDVRTDVVSSVRRLLVRGSASVEDALVAEALRVAEVMAESTEANPLLFSGMNAERLRSILTYLEDRTFALAEALATVARYDREGVLIDAVCRSLQVIAKEPQPTGMHYTYAAQFRLYPLILCVYALVLVAANERRGDLLKAVFNLSLQRDQREGVEPIVVGFRRIKAASDVFKEALGKNYFEPIAVRVREVLLPRLSGLLVGTSSKDAFFVAEFILGLAFLKVSESTHHSELPLPGTYFYESGAQRTLSVFLGQRLDWLEDALEEPLDSLLPAFDETAAKVVNPHAWADGFTSGAMAAYRPRGKP